jgi:small GTP-binding protein
MQLLKRHGAKLVTAERLLTELLLSKNLPSTIHIEAKLAMTKAKTIQGAKIIANQTEHGLYQKAIHWQKDIDLLTPGQIASQAGEISNSTKTARLIIAGCTMVLAGPPNTGKSTLLNYLAGREKSIVTDIAGTTRDWVSAQIRIEPMAVTLIDTAGLGGDFSLNIVDKAAQQKTCEIIHKTDLVLLILDNSQSADQLDDSLLKAISNKRVVTVLNKADLPARFDTVKLPENLTDTVQVSAKFGTGLDKLTEKIRRRCGIADFDLKTPVCFTERQEYLLRQLTHIQSKDHAISIISELLNGPLCV